MVDDAAVPAAAAKKKATDDAEAAAAAAAKKKATDDAEAAAAAAALTWPTGGNKGLMLSAGIVGLLEQMTSNPRLAAAATALYLNLSFLTDAKSVIASTQAVPFLVDRLYNHDACDPKASSCKHDALYTLYNLSTHQASIPSLLSAGIVDALHTLLTDSSVSEGIGWTEKALAVAISLAATPAGRKEIMSTPGLVSTLAVLLDTGEPTEQEQEVSCLLAMCAADDKCIAPVLQEGVVPSLVSVSTTGTGRGREKAQKLLKLFREQRQRDGGQPPASQHQQPQQEQQRRENDSNTEINSGCCVVL